MRARKSLPRQGSLYAAPLGLWLSLFFAVPVLIVLIYAFLEKGPRGGVEWEFSLQAFQSLLNENFLRVGANTLLISIVTSFITIVVALPCAYYLARKPDNTVLLMLIIIPFWVNFLIRVFAWLTILGREGFINAILLSLGIVAEPVQFLYNLPAVILVHVYSYLPYAILPLYSAVEKFDFTLLEAGRDLGAGHFTSLRRILLPNVKGGIFAAVIFTLVPTLGSYAIPVLVGSTESYMLGNIIADQVTVTRNWPLASAVSVVITLFTTIALLVYFTSNRRRERQAVQLRDDDDKA